MGGTLKNIKWARVGGLAAGIALADSVFGEFSRQAALRSGDVTAALEAIDVKVKSVGGSFEDAGFQNLLSREFANLPLVGGLIEVDDTAVKARDRLLEVMESGRAISSEEARGLVNTLKEIEDLSPAAIVELDRFTFSRAEVERFNTSLQNIQGSFSDAFDLTEIADRSRQNWRIINSHWGKGSEEARRLTSINFFAAKESIEDAMEGGRISVKDGKAAIERLMERFNIKPLTNQFKKVDQDARRHFAGVEEAASKMRGRTEPLFKGVEQDARRAFAGVGDAAGEAKDKTLSRTARMAQGVSNNVGGMVDAVGGGIETLIGNTNQALGSFGVKKIKFVAKQVGKAANINPFGRQRGGPIDIGAPSGDSVPAMLEKGEYVVNRRAVQAVGKDRLDAINFGAAPRFQKGGGLGDVANLNPGIMSLVRWAGKRFGLTVSSGFRASSTTHHGRGDAADFVPPSLTAAKGIDSAWRSKLAELIFTPMGHSVKNGQKVAAFAQSQHYDHIHAAITGKGGGPMMQEIKRVLLSGPDGPLKDMGQGALDKVRRAARDHLSKQTMDVGHGNVGVLGDARLRSILTKALRITGHYSPANLAALTRQALSESGGDPRAINLWDSNASRGTPSKGLLQTIDPTFNAYKMKGMGDIWNPLHNAVAAIRYMMARYGQIIGHGRGYQSGGMVDLWGKGMAHFAGGGLAGRAKQRYEGLWKKTSPFFEAEGMPAPRVELADLTKVSRDPEGMLSIFLGEQHRKGLATKMNFPGMRRAIRRAQPGRERKQARRALRQRKRQNLGEVRRNQAVMLHEMAHIFQAPFIKGNLMAAEGGASLFADKVFPQIFPGGRRFTGVQRYPEPYLDAFRKMMGTSDEAVLKHQFLGRLGKDPTTFQRGGVLPYAGSFDGGGVVPGPVGRPALATVHGGEKITPPAKPTRYEITITNWRTGEGYMREIAADEVANEGAHSRQLDRMHR